MEKVLKSKDFYKEKIIEMVKGIDNEKFIKFIYHTLCSFKKKWGV